MTLGRSIKYWRKQKKLSQKDLAQILNIPASTLSNYETDFRSPSIDTLRSIATALDITIDALAGPYTAVLTMGEDHYYLSEHDERNIRTNAIAQTLNKLNIEGLKKVDAYASDLTKIDEFKRKQ